MISILLLVVLAWSFYIGYSRGFLLQLYYTAAGILSLVIAAAHYKKLAAVFYLWIPFANATEGSSNHYFDSKYLFDLDQVFYAGLAFLLIVLAAYVVFRLIGILVHLAQSLSPDTTLFNMISGGLSVLVTLVFLQMVLTIAATIPLATIQNLLKESVLANGIIRYVPIMTGLLEKLWVTNMLG